MTYSSMLIITKAVVTLSTVVCSVCAERSGSGVEFRTLREPGFESCAAVLKPWASF